MKKNKSFKTKECTRLSLSALTLSLLAITFSSAGYTADADSVPLKSYAEHERIKSNPYGTYINKLEDSGFQFQKLYPNTWKATSTIPSYDWNDRRNIVMRYNIRYASQLNELLLSAIQQMPTRASALLTSNLASPDELNCQSEIDAYAMGAEEQIELLDANGLFDHTMDKVNWSIDQAREGYRRSGELDLIEQSFLNQPSDLYHNDFFVLIDYVNNLEVHTQPESQMKAKEIRENAVIQQLKEIYESGRITGWHSTLALEAMSGSLSSQNKYDMTMLAIQANPEKPITELYSFTVPTINSSQTYSKNIINYANLLGRDDILYFASSNDEDSELKKNLSVFSSAGDYTYMARSITAPLLNNPANQDLLIKEELENNRLIENCINRLDIVIGQTIGFVNTFAKQELNKAVLNSRQGFSSDDAFKDLLSEISKEDHSIFYNSKKNIEAIKTAHLSETMEAMRKNGGWQIFFEGLSGIPMHWVDQKLFNLLLNYYPGQFREIDKLKIAIEENASTPQTDFYLQLIDLAVSQRMSSTTKFSLAISLAAYDFLSVLDLQSAEYDSVTLDVEAGIWRSSNGDVIDKPKNTDQYDLKIDNSGGKKIIRGTARAVGGDNMDSAVKAVRAGDGNEHIVMYSGVGFDLFNNTILALAASYSSIFLDPDTGMWESARNGIISMPDNLDEYAFTWDNDKKIGLPRSSAERHGPRESTFWCLGRAHEKMELSGPPDSNSGIFALYGNVRHQITRIKEEMVPETKIGNGYVHIGRLYNDFSYWDEERDGSKPNPIYYEGQLVRAIGLPTTNEALADKELMNIYVETMNPTVYAYEIPVEEEDMNSPPLIGYGYAFDGESGYQWYKYTCKTGKL